MAKVIRKIKWSLVVILISINCAAASALRQETSTCGIPQQQGIGLIIGGQNMERSWPWMVALLERSRGKYNFFCGGTLISKTKVVTGNFEQKF